ncbi:MAG: LysM peptidoglycan-binding domain-containing protein [Saprospirales bacterium]|nr:LysM peptidoglycan-binding domain-containing protein [Saprospirales bacterium]
MLERRNMADYYRSGASYLYRIDDQQAGYFLMEKCRGLTSAPQTYSTPQRPAYYNDIPAEYSTGYQRTAHTVQAGETLSAISRRYGVSVETLKKWNNLSDADHIRPGQLIYLDETIQIKSLQPILLPYETTGSPYGSIYHWSMPGTVLRRHPYRTNR